MFSRSEKYIAEQRGNWQHTDRQDKAGYFWYEPRSQDSQLSNVVIFKSNSNNKYRFVSLCVVTEHCSASVQAAHMNRSSFHMYLMHGINMNKHQNILFQLRNTPFFKFKSTEVKLSGTQNKYFKGIPLAYCRYCGSQQQHGLTLRTFLYLVILKKVQFSRGRWRLAMAAHNKYY